MILANKNGNLTAVEFLRETPKAYIYKDLSKNGQARIKERRLSKADEVQRLFSAINDAIEWAGGI